LRIGRDGRRDEPGAADFYYGEMEMRRHAVSKTHHGARRLELSPSPPYDSTRPTPPTERAVLFLYWLSCGYGQRPGRALGALLVTLVCGAVLLWKLGGLHESPVLVAVESSMSPLESLDLKPATHLSWASETVIVGLRLLGTLFLGLAVLSLRGRIAR
jgi:hypothetical protein